MERGLIEIYRFLPPPLLESFDPEKIDSFDEFLDYVAKGPLRPGARGGHRRPGDREGFPGVTPGLFLPRRKQGVNA